MQRNNVTYLSSNSTNGHCNRNCYIVAALLIVLAISSAAFGQTTSASETCPRPITGATVTDPPELRSHNGELELSLHFRYEQTPPSEGPPRYCYITDDGLESPTLRVHPGDQLIIHLHNDLPALSPTPSMTHKMEGTDDGDCTGHHPMNSSMTNLHFHGMTIPPVCHQDEVLRTAVAPGEEFDYRVTIPRDEPPGLYWYHPHPHGFGERQVQGGASGAIIVEGIERVIPSLSPLRQRVLVLRDQQRIGPEAQAPSVPAWDISANFVPVTYPTEQPAKINVEPGAQEFWRVVNAGADTIFNLQIVSHQVPQPLRIVAIDGVPTKSGQATTPTSILLPPGARAEFLVTTPAIAETAELVTTAWDTGPSGDTDTKRTIAEIVSCSRGSQPATRHPKARAISVPSSEPDAAPVAHRLLYFSQHSSNAQDPDNFVLYYLTVDGQSPAPYKMGQPPNIVVHQDDVEDWTIENRATEDHVFHIHQIHFRILAINGKRVNDPTMRDTVDLPYWRGEGPYPNVTLRVNFSDPNDVGTFLYHCHILKHEDMGMMGAIQVLPKGEPPVAAKPRSTAVQAIARP
jgi:FtsP/CotA-like multicopper oxidase with cupredoxin domain